MCKYDKCKQIIIIKIAIVALQTEVIDDRRTKENKYV